MKKWWTTREEAYLIDMFNHYNIQQIADKLGRSYWSVRHKIASLQKNKALGRKPYFRTER